MLEIIHNQMWPFLDDSVCGSKPQACKAPTADSLISAHIKFKKRKCLKKWLSAFH